MAIKSGPFPSGDSKNATTVDRPTATAWRKFIGEHWENKSEMPGGQISRTVGRNTGAGHGYFSKHAEGIAVDFATGGPEPRGWSFELMHALVNASEELQLVEVIHGEYKWNCNKTGWLKYNGYNHHHHVHFATTIEACDMGVDAYLKIIESVMTNPNISDPFPDSPRPQDPKPEYPNTHLIGGSEQGAGKSSGTGASTGNGGGSNASDSGAAVVNANYGPVSEENLTGMESYKEYKANIEGWDPASVETNYDKDFSKQEKYTVANIKASLEADKTSPQEFASRGITFVGLLGIFYSLLMVGAHLFDRANVFFEFNALKAITLGRMESVYDKDDVSQGRSSPIRANFPKVLWYAGVAMLFSLILISGVVFGWLEELITFVQSRLQ